MRAYFALVVLVLAPLASAQSSDAPHPAPEAQTLYAHGTGNDEFAGFLNTLEEDGSDGAMGSGDALSGSQTWTWSLDPALQARLVLDAEGTIDVTAHVGGSTHVGDVSVSMQITHGDTVVATGDAQDHTITPADAGDGLYGQVTWSLAPDVTEISPGEELVWTLTVEGTATAVFIGTGEGRGRSHLVLPIAAVDAPPGTEVFYEDVDSEDLTVSLDLDNTTAVYHYNWTMGPAALVLSAQGNLTGGNLTVQVVDAHNATVYTAELAGPINVTQQRTGTPGNWTVTLNLTQATGNVSLLLGHPAPGADGPSGNATGNTTGNSGEDSPAWTAAVLAVGLVTLAALRRRP